jgi:hypothetical protein
MASRVLTANSARDGATVVATGLFRAARGQCSTRLLTLTFTAGNQPTVTRLSLNQPARANI